MHTIPDNLIHIPAICHIVFLPYTVFPHVHTPEASHIFLLSLQATHLLYTVSLILYTIPNFRVHVQELISKAVLCRRFYFPAKDKSLFSSRCIQKLNLYIAYPAIYIHPKFEEHGHIPFSSCKYQHSTFLPMSSSSIFYTLLLFAHPMLFSPATFSNI